MKKWHAENDKLSPARRRKEPQKPEVVYIRKSIFFVGNSRMRVHETSFLLKIFVEIIIENSIEISVEISAKFHMQHLNWKFN